MNRIPLTMADFYRIRYIDAGCVPDADEVRFMFAMFDTLKTGLVFPFLAGAGDSEPVKDAFFKRVCRTYSDHYRDLPVPTHRKFMELINR